MADITRKELVQQGYIWSNSGWVAGPSRIAKLRRTYAPGLTDAQCDLLLAISAHSDGYVIGRTRIVNTDGRTLNQECAVLCDRGYVKCEPWRPNMHATDTGCAIADLIRPESCSHITIFFVDWCR